MRTAIRAVILLCALVIAAGTASAREGTTTTELGLHSGPAGNTELLLTMPAGSKVYVGVCSGGWCKVTWKSYSGYAIQSHLVISAAAAPSPHVVRRGAYASGGDIVPIFPPYPYRAGYYPKADWYFDIPPYTSIEPSFYRRRYFMMAQERNRYRYMPHIFHGNRYGGGPVESVNLHSIAATLKETEATAPMGAGASSPH
jgi:uncharacterized protein YraI